MHYKTASTSAHTLMKTALDHVEKLLQNSSLEIKQPEILIAAFLESATQLYLHEQMQKADNHRL